MLHGDNTLIDRDSIIIVCQDSSRSSSTFATRRWIVGAVEIASDLTACIDAAPGNVLLRTEGAGDRTVSTAALYCEMHEIVDGTINITFTEAARKRDRMVARVRGM
jgi:hydrogenase maturation factor HypE